LFHEELEERESVREEEMLRLLKKIDERLDQLET
jgi:hypothetical protein